MGTKWLVKYVVCRLMRRQRERERENSCTFFRHTQHKRTYAHTNAINTVTTIVYSQATAVLCALSACNCARCSVLDKSQLSYGSTLHTPNADSHRNICTGVIAVIYSVWKRRRRRSRKCEIIWWFVEWTHSSAHLFALNLFKIALLGIVLHWHVIEVCNGPFNALIWTAIIST